MRQEVAVGQMVHQRLFDAGFGEREVIDVSCQRQLGYGHLVLDLTGLLLGDPGGQ